MTDYYVDSAASGTGDGLSEVNAFTTIDAGMNIIATAGTGPHTVYVKASGTYSETPVIDTVGTTTAPITFEGYTTSTGDNGKVTVSGTTNCLTSTLGAAFYIFKNFIFTGSSSDCVSMGNTDKIAWINCEFNNSGGDGVFCDNDHIFLNCVAHGNAAFGIDADIDNKFIGCVFYSNTFADVVSSGAACYAYKCVCYGAATGDALRLDSFANVIACTLDGEGTGNRAIGGGSAANAGVIDNILYDWTTAVDMSATPDWEFVACYNLLNSNTTDYETVKGMMGYGDVTSAPAFTDEAGDDYRPSSSSPAVDAQLKPGGIT